MKHIHVMGIAGSGASAAAAVAAGNGWRVSGCDRQMSGHDPSHLKSVDMLVVSPAVFFLDPRNREIIAAEEKKMPILSWPAFVGTYLQKGKFVIAIAGTHGKSTTTSLIGLILEKGLLDPTVIVGAEVLKWHQNYRVGKSKYFVIEADEYNNSFLAYQPDIAVITAVDYDHPEYFPSASDYAESFARFVRRCKPGGLVIRSSAITANDPVLDDFAPAVPFQRQNAATALSVARSLHISDNVTRLVFRSFRGVARRFEIRGVVDGVTVVDDYGHHPTEIDATLTSARARYPDRRILVVFQPHMFTRTRVLFNDFVRVLREAPVDRVIVVDIFPSREKDPGNVSSRDLVLAIKKKTVQYKGGLSAAADAVRSMMKKGNVVIAMGAGDITKVSDILLEKSSSTK